MNPFTNNKNFGIELEKLMKKYPEMKIYTALNMAVKNLKRGDFATYNIRSDWDKYGSGSRYKFAPELQDLCVKFGIMNSDGTWIREGF